jgi:hypothetical protein
MCLSSQLHRKKQIEVSWFRSAPGIKRDPVSKITSTGSMAQVVELHSSDNKVEIQSSNHATIREKKKKERI